MTTCRFLCEPTQVKCSARFLQMLCHWKRTLFMLREATSTNFWRQNFLGLSWSANSSRDTRHRFSMKSTIPSVLSFSLCKKMASIWLPSI
jgi:hypothetical protein